MSENRTKSIKIQQLTAKHYKIAELIKTNVLTYNEIAKLMKCSKSTVANTAIHPDIKKIIEKGKQEAKKGAEDSKDKLIKLQPMAIDKIEKIFKNKKSSNKDILDGCKIVLKGVLSDKAEILIAELKETNGWDGV